MLIGEYTHSVDDKSRIALPSKFRKELGKKVIITRGLDTCLFLYSMSEWEKLSKHVGELGLSKADKRGLNRFLFAGAQEVDIDKNGRILIPDFLKTFAGLKSKVVFAGVYDRIEIWNDQAWSKYKRKIEGQADVLAEQLGETKEF
ncbi:MAG: division/cell wall cluster transcriptional repressor MraZ [Candidatus Paceibacterota bacterium]